MNAEERYYRAITADVVLTHQFVRRVFRVTQAQAKRLGVTIVKEQVAPTAKSRLTEIKPTTFHALREDGKRLSLHQLRHYAGTAAIRDALGAPPEVWESAAGAMGRSFTPDAIWSSPDGPTMIEFDAGSYDRHVVINKMTVFHENHRTTQVWGAATQARVAYLQAIAEELRIPVRVLLATWFD